MCREKEAELASHRTPHFSQGLHVSFTGFLSALPASYTLETKREIAHQFHVLCAAFPAGEASSLTPDQVADTLHELAKTRHWNPTTFNKYRNHLKHWNLWTEALPYLKPMLKREGALFPNYSEDCDSSRQHDSFRIDG